MEKKIKKAMKTAQKTVEALEKWWKATNVQIVREGMLYLIVGDLGKEKLLMSVDIQSGKADKNVSAYHPEEWQQCYDSMAELGRVRMELAVAYSQIAS